MSRLRVSGLLTSVIAMLAMLAAPGSAVAAVVWRVDSLANTTVQPGGTINYLIQLTNVGDTTADGTTGPPIVFSATLPAGITAQDAT